jgi:hypothetical protein
MEQLIAELKEKGFGLGGSRRMAEKYPAQINLRDDTDWDFYGSDTPDNRQFLTERGFKKVDADDRTYWDDMLVEMYKHPELPIEVLIRKDVAIYRSSFEALSAEVFMERLWKSSPLADPNICKAQFRRTVCDYFNGLFRLHGFKPSVPSTDLLAF